MVRKVSVLFVCFALVFAFGNRAQALTFEVSKNLPTNVIEYARDIVTDIPINEDYLLFGCELDTETVYYLMVGEFGGTSDFETISFLSGTIYTFESNGYNSYQYYVVTDFDAEEIGEEFRIVRNGYIIYSSLGNNPRLISLGEKYEFIQTYTLCAVVLFVLFVRIFGKR